MLNANSDNRQQFSHKVNAVSDGFLQPSGFSELVERMLFIGLLIPHFTLR